MNERTEDHEHEHTEQGPSYEEETAKDTSTRSKTDNEMKDYQEVISAIESIMKDENISFSEKNSPNLGKTNIGKILSFLNKEINEERNLTEA